MTPTKGFVRLLVSLHAPLFTCIEHCHDNFPTLSKTYPQHSESLATHSRVSLPEVNP
jgi:hypothetical protein